MQNFSAFPQVVDVKLESRERDRILTEKGCAEF